MYERGKILIRLAKRGLGLEREQRKKRIEWRK
jgi:hypothetical protein